MRDPTVRSFHNNVGFQPGEPPRISGLLNRPRKVSVQAELVEEAGSKFVRESEPVEAGEWIARLQGHQEHAGDPPSPTPPLVLTVQDRFHCFKTARCLGPCNSSRDDHGGSDPPVNRVQGLKRHEFCYGMFNDAAVDVCSAIGLIDSDSSGDMNGEYDASIIVEFKQNRPLVGGVGSTEKVGHDPSSVADSRA